MAYLHIDNLYKNQDILMFKECYAMEKIHGTSAHISYRDNDVHFFSGGEKNDKFVNLFDKEFLKKKFEELDLDEVIIYGEAYGGKQQGMSATYGKELKFIAFEVKIGHCWLDVPKAEDFVKNFNIEFVYYCKMSTTIESLDIEKNKYSVQAIRNGIEEDRPREGIVLRPLIELRKNNNARIISKHKCEAFRETRTKREVTDVDKLRILKEAKAIAEEWVTEMRLSHVLDKFPDVNITQTGDVIRAMVADIKRESEKEVEWTKEVQKEVSRESAKMFKKRIMKI